MESTYTILKKQITQRLADVPLHQPIHINRALSDVLDSYDIPEKAKLACLTIDTAMCHLDAVPGDHLSKQSILIGDLLSAHFYTILAELNNPSYQAKISQAIVEVNELKSSIHHNQIDKQQIEKTILTIECLFPIVTIQHYIADVNTLDIQAKMFDHDDAHLSFYLRQYSKEEQNTFFKNIKQNYIHKRGNLK